MVLQVNPHRLPGDHIIYGGAVNSTSAMTPQLMPSSDVASSHPCVALSEALPGVWVFSFPSLITGVAKLELAEDVPAGLHLDMLYCSRRVAMGAERVLLQ